MSIVVFLALVIFHGASLGQSKQVDRIHEDDACAAADQALAQSQWETAQGLYSACVSSDPANFEAYSNMGIVLSRLGYTQKAIDAYKKALTLSHDNPKVEFNLAVLLIKAGNCEAALQYLAKYGIASPDTRATELLAYCYYHLGRYSLAARAAERVYQLHPDDPANALILGSAYTQLGLYEKALPLITLSLKAAGSAEGHLIMGETLLGLRLYHPAKEELAQAAASQSDLMGLHTAIGMDKVGLGDSEGAAAEFKEAIREDATDFQANYYMGRLSRLGGDIASANKYLKIATELRPNTPEVTFEIAAIAVSEHRYIDAMPLLKSVLQLEPDHEDAHFLLATCYQKTGDKEAAQREREIFLKLQSSKDSKEKSGSNRDQEESGILPSIIVKP